MTEMKLSKQKLLHTQSPPEQMAPHTHKKDFPIFGLGKQFGCPVEAGTELSTFSSTRGACYVRSSDPPTHSRAGENHGAKRGTTIDTGLSFQ